MNDLDSAGKGPVGPPLGSWLKTFLGVFGAVAILASFRAMLVIGIGMLLWVSASHARASLRTGKVRPMLMALAALPAAIFLAAFLASLL